MTSTESDKPISSSYVRGSDGTDELDEVHAIGDLDGEIDVVADVTDEARSALTPASVPRFLRFGADWAWRFLLVCAAVYVLVWVVIRLRVVMIPVFVALVFTALLTPVVNVLARRMPRLLATWITILALVGLFIGGGYLLAQPIVDAFDELSTQLDPALEDLRNWLQTGPLGFSESRVDELFDSTRRQADNFVQGFTDNPGSTARVAGEVIAGALLAFVLMFFALKDGPAMWRWVVTRVRPIRRPALDRAGQASFSSMQGWLRAAAITGVVDGVIIGAALLILGVPAAVPLAVLTFFAAFFPIVGATAAGALATLVAYASEGIGTAIAIAVIVLVVQQVEGDVVMPLVMQRETSLHPVVVLLALAAGAALGGIVGALVAVPVTAAIVSAVAAVSGVETPKVTDRLVLPDGVEPSGGQPSDGADGAGGR